METPTFESMKRIGLTGGIGSGKTMIAELFRNLGVPVFNSDDAARKIQNENVEVRNRITEIFGDVYDLPDKTLNRKKVAALVFSDAVLLEKLNAVVHPAVGEAFEEFCSQNAGAAYVIKEAAIIFEAGIEKHLHGVILVTAPESVRIDRVMKRDNTTAEDVIARIRKQWPDERKMQMAKWCIRNDGKFPLLPQVIKIHEAISR